MILNAVIEKDEFGYFAQIPELKGCVTQGKTYEEVLSNIQEAAELYLESLQIDEVKALQKRKVSISLIEVDIHA
jgi:predicted RNase H-like HicB family nuclease